MHRLSQRTRWTIGRGVVLALLAALGVAILRPRPPQPPTSISSVAELETYLLALTSYGTPPGLSLAVVKDGQLVYARGFGQADTPRGLSATAATSYGWWSMTKIATAAAILQLQEQGKLSIDDPVTDHLPFFAVSEPSAASRPVTIRDLLNHSSGMPNNVPALIGWIHHAEEPPLNQTTYLQSILPAYSTLAFEPGDHGEYTNVGYMVLGAVIEAASGESYQEYISAHLLRPLGMSCTDFIFSAAGCAEAATASHPWLSIESAALPFLVKDWGSYVRETTKGRMWLHQFYANSAPPTGLIGPATDASRFVAAILNGGELDGQRILSPESVRMMIRDSHVPGQAGESETYPGMSYGLGWHVVPEGERLRIQHRGGGPGFGTEMRLYPEERLGMVVMANDTTYDRDIILDLVAQLDWPESPPAPARAGATTARDT